jgi:hypothetical protein
MTALVYQRLHRFVNLQYFFAKKDEASEHTLAHTFLTLVERVEATSFNPRIDVSTTLVTDRCDALHGAYLAD